jgi:diguanylate cyclase (GGDEF)-like protein
MIDVDLFKALNDIKGHLTGDQYLIQIATALHLNLTGSTDFVARYGGEEFCAILPATDSRGAWVAAEKLRKGVVDLGLNHPNSHSGIVTVSIDVSTFDGSALSSPAQLLKTADRALYIAKSCGRNRCEFSGIKSSPIPVSFDLMAK